MSEHEPPTVKSCSKDIEAVIATANGDRSLMLAHIKRIEDNLSGFKEYYKLAHTSLEKQMVQALEASDKAVLKAEAAEKDRFEGFNKFNERATEERRTVATKDELAGIRDSLNAVRETLTGRIDRLDNQDAKVVGATEGRDRQSTMFFAVAGLLIGGVGALAGFLVFGGSHNNETPVAAPPQVIVVPSGSVAPQQSATTTTTVPANPR